MDRQGPVVVGEGQRRDSKARARRILSAPSKRRVLPWRLRSLGNKNHLWAPRHSANRVRDPIQTGTCLPRAGGALRPRRARRAPQGAAVWRRVCPSAERKLAGEEGGGALGRPARFAKVRWCGGCSDPGADAMDVVNLKPMPRPGPNTKPGTSQAATGPPSATVDQPAPYP